MLFYEYEWFCDRSCSVDELKYRNDGEYPEPIGFSLKFLRFGPIIIV